MTTLFLTLIAIVIVLCIWLNNLSSRVGIPALLAFIALGILFGNNGIFAIRLENYLFAKETCTVALIFIMFYGGFGTRWDAARPVVMEAALLASAGVVVTAGLTGLFCHFVFGWNWIESLLMGSVVSSTDAASVFSILRSKRLGLKNNTASMLEVESGSNDPCSYMLTAIMLSLMKGDATGWSLAWMIFAQVAFGAGTGFLLARSASWILEKVRIKEAGYDSLFLLAMALSAYAIPDLLGGNGYLSVYIVGIILGNTEFRNKKAQIHFFDGITGLMQVIIFFLLGLLARPADLGKVILPALAIFAFMLLVARPASVGAVLAPFRKYPLRQMALVSFVGLRGAASIVFAILAGVNHGPMLQHDIFNTVFCIVLISISLQGSLIPWAARRLDMIDAGSNVMKTFSDYSEDSLLQFGSVEIKPGCKWSGKAVRDLGLPANILIALVLRGEERLIPRGDFEIRDGDRLVITTKAFEDNRTTLLEKRVKPGSRRIGHTIAEESGDGLVLLVRRGDEEIFPSGDTVLEEGDGLVLLRQRD